MWRYLLAWELRYAVRRSAFWLMLLGAALLPVAFGWAMARAYGQPGFMLYAPACGAQMVLLSVLVAAWTALSAKRQVSSELSDDWLLVITWRQSLLARYAAAALMGLAMALASTVAMRLAIAWCGGTGAMLAVAAQRHVFGAVLQGLASAAVVVGAADFLLASQATVLSVQLAVTLFWSFVPFLGFFWPAWVLTDPANLGTPDGALLFAQVAKGLCLVLFGFGWLRSEDFWLLLAERRRDGYDASIGEIRSEIAGSQTANSAGSRLALAASRARWRQLRLPPWLVADLARYPVIALPRGSAGWGRLIKFALLLGTVLLAYVGATSAAGREVDLDWIFWQTFGWWAALVIVLLRALASGVQIVAQEREQGTLADLATTPVGLAYMLNGKVLVVVWQAVPWLVLLVAWAWDGHTLPFSSLVPLIVAAALLAPCAAALFGSRLLAVLAAGGGAFLLIAVLWAQAARFACNWPGMFHKHLNQCGELIAMELVILVLPLVWFAARDIALVWLRRSAGSQTA
ncbi:MAG: hypothetical protein HZB16_05170 [Armatimonadetes bacterium]|nr:hypothetical protein [Armatimonadota bacterium]